MQAIRLAERHTSGSVRYAARRLGWEPTKPTKSQIAQAVWKFCLLRGGSSLVAVGKSTLRGREVWIFTMG